MADHRALSGSPPAALHLPTSASMTFGFWFAARAFFNVTHAGGIGASAGFGVGIGAVLGFVLGVVLGFVPPDDDVFCAGCTGFVFDVSSAGAAVTTPSGVALFSGVADESVVVADALVVVDGSNVVGVTVFFLVAKYAPTEPRMRSAATPPRIGTSGGPLFCGGECWGPDGMTGGPPIPPAGGPGLYAGGGVIAPGGGPPVPIIGCAISVFGRAG